jgi:hypothetical protein
MKIRSSSPKATRRRMVPSDDTYDHSRTAVCSCWAVARPILPPMGSSEGQRYAMAFARSDGCTPLALSFLSTERAAFGPRKLAEKRADTE